MPNSVSAERIRSNSSLSKNHRRVRSPSPSRRFLPHAQSDPRRHGYRLLVLHPVRNLRPTRFAILQMTLDHGQGRAPDRYQIAIADAHPLLRRQDGESVLAGVVQICSVPDHSTAMAHKFSQPLTMPLPAALMYPRDARLDNTVIGVDFLFEPDVLVELEAYAILD